MKRLLGLVVLFVVFNVCAPSYGYFLIYNVSTTVKGTDDHTDAKVTIPLKGYLVLNLADDDGAMSDANLILYGIDANTPKKQKVYVRLNKSDSNQFLGGEIRYVGELMSLYLWGSTDFNFSIMFQGKMTSKDIGLGTPNKKLVAGSIKGVNLVWDSFLLGPDGAQNILGTSTASASLYIALTKTVNNNGWTQEEIMQKLLIVLTDKGYVAATLPNE